MRLPTAPRFQWGGAKVRTLLGSTGDGPHLAEWPPERPWGTQGGPYIVKHFPFLALFKINCLP